MTRPSRQQILEYALSGLRTEIGIHPCPNEYPDEIREYEEHFEWIEKELEKLKALELT